MTPKPPVMHQVGSDYISPERVRQLVLAAYEEGFLDGAEHGNLDWKYPPYIIAWLKSTARTDAGFPPLTAVQAASITLWTETPNINRRRQLSFDGIEP